MFRVAAISIPRASRTVARHSLRSFSSSSPASKIFHSATPETLTAVLEDSRKTDRRVIIDFYADWCGPCKTLSPTIERVAEDESLNVDLVTIDIDAQMELAQAYKVTAVPTVIGARAGELKNKFIGAVPEPAIRKFCADL